MRMSIDLIPETPNERAICETALLVMRDRVDEQLANAAETTARDLFCYAGFLVEAAMLHTGEDTIHSLEVWMSGRFGGRGPQLAFNLIEDKS